MSRHNFFVCAMVIHALFVNGKPSNRKYQQDWIQGGIRCNGKEVHIPDSYENQLNETMKLCKEKVFNLTLSLKNIKQKEPDSFKQGFKDKSLCLIACEMQELELIDEHGAFVEEEVNNFIKDAVPNEEATHLIAKFKECTLKFGNKLEISDNCENTEKNRDLIQCARAGVKEVCKIEGIGHLHGPHATVCSVTATEKKA